MDIQAPGTAFESSEDCDGNQVVDGIPREQNRGLGPRKSDGALKAAKTGMLTAQQESKTANEANSSGHSIGPG
jgi:hypothetical protein